jgi:hypothetical protein
MHYAPFLFILKPEVWSLLPATHHAPHTTHILFPCAKTGYNKNVIKILFKLFGLGTVVFFVAFFGVAIAVKTMPPVYSIRQEVKDYLYPVTREHLKGKFNDFLADIQSCKRNNSFEISELELNSYLYYLFSDVLLVEGKPVVENPYMFVQPGQVKLRVDIPAGNALRLLSNGLNDMKLDENVKKVMKARSDDSAKSRETSGGGEGTLALTFIMSVHWVKDHPYFYLERVYAGVMPIPVSILLSGYQDQVNTNIWSFYQKSFSLLPVYIRKIEARNKVLRFNTELKMTNQLAPVCDLNNFRKNNPDLARALESEDCLYGCTDKEKEEMDKFYKSLTGSSAGDVQMAKLIVAKAMTGKMRQRDLVLREKKINKFKPREQRPERIIMPQQDVIYDDE